jgi:hypothetical protein
MGNPRCWALVLAKPSMSSSPESTSAHGDHRPVRGHIFIFNSDKSEFPAEESLTYWTSVCKASLLHLNMAGTMEELTKDGGGLI